MSANDIQKLAQDILELSKTYQPNNATPGNEPEILNKAKGLVAALQSPMDHSMALNISMVEGSSIRTLLSLNVLQSIPASGSINLSDLSSITGAQKALLQRLLRVVVGSGFLALDSDGSFCHTPKSLPYASTSAGNLGGIFSYIFDETKVFTCLPEYLRKYEPKEPDGETATTHNPSTWFHGQEGKTVFEILEQDPEKLKGFHSLMDMAKRFRPFTGFYDFGKLAESDDGRPALVDVGGADGTTVARILEAHPNVQPSQCVVQDRESVIELAKQNSDLPKGVQLQPHDFFQPQPVKGAHAYLLRAICHDWSDTMVVEILNNIASAMSPSSKVLIADNVLPEGGVSGMAAYMDVMMLCIGGKERTKKNFEEVLDAAGLKLDGIYPAPISTGFAVVEASLK